MNWFAFARRAIVALVLMALTVTGAWSQNVGSLEGTVADPTGSSVDGAKVTLTDLGNNTTRTTTTSATGAFSFVQLTPGKYKLEVSKDGFKAHVEDNVGILVATPTRADIRLELGAITQQVLVEGASVPALNLQDATVGNTFEEDQVKSLPFLARNVINLLTLQPGVVFTGQSDTDRLSQGDIATLDPREGAVDGVRGNQTNVTLDGVDANDWQNQAAFTTALPITLDSVQEFRVTTSNANATNGIVGGPQVELVTKSGTSQFHGNARWYYRTSGTAANDFFNNFNQIPRGKDQRNIAGGSLGGPIIKDRLFFFVDSEYRREAVSAPLAFPRQVPSEALRHGVLAYDCTGSTTVACPTAPTTVIGTDGTAVTIPANAFGLSPAQFQTSDPAHLGINQAMLAYMQLFPAGNNPSAAFDGGFSFDALSFNTTQGTNNNIYIARIDYLLTKNGHHSVFWRGGLQGLKTDVVQSQFPGIPPAAQLLNNSRGYAVQYQGQITPNIVNTARYGLTRSGVNESGTQGASFAVRSFSTNLDFASRQFGRTVPVHNINDDLSWTHGRHQFTMGGALFFVRNHNINETNSFPAYSANNGFCQRLCSDYDLGAAGAPDPADPTSFIRAYMMLTGSITQVNATVFATPDGSVLPVGTPESRHFAENLYEGYFQDSWKIKPNVTITAGLRYGYETPPWETKGFQVAPSTDILAWFRDREIGMNQGIPSDASPLLSWSLAGKANHGADSWFRPNAHDLSPRFAVAYSPGFSSGVLGDVFGGPGKTSIRLGAGLFYDRIGQALALDSDQNGSPGTATALINGSQQFTLATAPRFSGSCDNTGCTGLPAAGPPFFTPPTTAAFPFTPTADTSNLGFAVDPHLKTPYTIHLAASIQRDLGHGIVLDVGYVGTLGRRLLGKSDLAQYLDIRDTVSGQDLFSAFRQTAALAHATPTATVAAIDPGNITALKTIPSIAFFNNVVPNMPAFTAAEFGDPAYATLTPTQAFYAFTTAASGVGAGGASWSCALFFMDTGIGGGVPSPYSAKLDPQGDGFVLFQQQFSQLDAWTNWANSNYHSLQVTLRKQVGFGSFAFNYVFSKSIDNDSSAENADLLSPNLSNGTAQGLIQNPFDLRLNRGLSDFNLKHNFNGFVVFDLPFGTGRRFASNANRLLDAAVGGWEITGAGRWRSGFPLSPGNGFNFPTNFFLTSSGTLTGPLSSKINRAEGTPPVPNLFHDAAAALADLTFTLPGLPGSRNSLTGPAYASLDMGVHKSFRLWKESTRLQLRATVFNVFNSVNFSDSSVSLDPTSPATFGQFTATASGRGREMEFAVRLEF